MVEDDHDVMARLLCVIAGRPWLKEGLLVIRKSNLKVPVVEYWIVICNQVSINCIVVAGIICTSYVDIDIIPVVEDCTRKKNGRNILGSVVEVLWNLCLFSAKKKSGQFFCNQMAVKWTFHFLKWNLPLSDFQEVLASHHSVHQHHRHTVRYHTYIPVGHSSIIDTRTLILVVIVDLFETHSANRFSR